MQEYVTDAVVLKKDPRGDLDGRYTFFTKRFGKIAGRATSSRRITSKLAPHLEPGTLVKISLIEAKGTQIVDALKFGKVTLGVADLQSLSDVLPEAFPEPEIWDLVTGGNFGWRVALAILGWDPAEAVCAACGASQPEFFSIPHQEFYCAAHASRARKDAVLLIDARI